MPVPALRKGTAMMCKGFTRQKQSVRNYNNSTNLQASETLYEDKTGLNKTKIRVAGLIRKC
jgi:hypothetical protein